MLSTDANSLSFPALQDIRLRFDSDPFTVRAALQSVLALLSPFGLCSDARERVETVLSEVLNNVSLHAYCTRPGRVELRIRHSGTALSFTVLDEGRPMPGGCLPPGILAARGEHLTLPEGGFGWFLIRSQARDLAYRRQGSRNRLSFGLHLGPDEMADQLN